MSHNEKDSRKRNGNWIGNVYMVRSKAINQVCQPPWCVLTGLVSKHITLCVHAKWRVHTCTRTHPHTQINSTFPDFPFPDNILYRLLINVWSNFSQFVLFWKLLSDSLGHWMLLPMVTAKLPPWILRKFLISVVVCGILWDIVLWVLAESLRKELCGIWTKRGWRRFAMRTPYDASNGLKKQEVL